MTTLTPRQQFVLALMANGIPRKQIAAHLGVTVWAVDDVIRHCLTDLGASNRAHAVAIALRHNLIQPESDYFANPEEGCRV